MLFFETVLQANGFIGAVVLGFITDLFLHAGRLFRKARPVWDVSALMASSLMLLIFLNQSNLELLRAYHLLGWLIGNILCTHGVIRTLKYMKAKKRGKSLVEQEKRSLVKKT